MRAAVVAAGALLVGAVAYAYMRGPREAGASIGGAAVDVAHGVGSGVVLGIGDIVGIPRTNETECERAMREGRTLDASFACPAGDFLEYLWS